MRPPGVPSRLPARPFSGPVKGWLLALCACAAYAAAVLPTLHRLEFFDGVEHFNLATVQEMRRNELHGQPVNWLLPTLEGEPRVVKPPLAAWVTAALVPPDAVRGLSDTEPAAQAAAFDRFVFRSRLPTLACACLLLVSTYELGRVLAGDWRVGALSVLICVGSLLFLQQGRRATTDLQLTLWVSWANALFAGAVFERRYWRGLVGGGIALGLAMMAKGPHIALLLTVAPLAAMPPLARWAAPALARVRGRLQPQGSDVVIPEHRQATAMPASAGSDRPDRSGVGRRGWVVPAAVGLLVAAAIGLWWYAYVRWTVPGVSQTWFREVLRNDAQVGRNVMPPDPWYAYKSLFGLLLPWTAWVVLGAGHVVLDLSRRHAARSRQTNGLLLAFLLVVVPVLVMSFFSEKKDRYLLPFAAPAAVLAAGAVVRHWDRQLGRWSILSGKSSAFPIVIPRHSAVSPVHRATGAKDGGPFGVPQDDSRSGIGQPKPASSTVPIAAGHVAEWITWAAAAWLVAGVPILGAANLKGYRTAAGGPWFTPGFAGSAAGVGLSLLVGGAVLARRWRVAAVVAVVLATWIGSEMRLRGDYSSPGDPDDRPQRQLAADIWHDFPAATVYSTDPPTLYGQLNRPAIVLSMHVDRVILPRPKELPAEPGPTPVVLITDAVGEPPPVPAGWRRWKEVPLRRGKRYVDVLAK